MDYSLYKAEDFAADESFISYYLGTDPHAVAFWQNWISLHPEMLDEVLTAEHLLDLLHLRLPQAELENEFSRLEAFLHHSTIESAPARKAPHYQISGIKNKKKIGLAAVILGIGTLVFALFFFKWHYATQQQITWVKYHTPDGQRSILKLSDGSRITLNGNTTLYYPEKFEGNKREVKLSGEAFFEIAHDTQKPFKVYAGQLTTTVLGTKFNIRNRDNEVKVALTEGRVKVRSVVGEEIILAPDQQVIYSTINRGLNKSAFDPEELLAWKEGMLIFKDASFTEVAEKLQQSFGLTVLNHSPQQQWHYNGRFKNTDYKTILESISFAKRISYTIQQDTVIFE